MSGSPRSRRKSKHKLEPISYEEMLGAAGMSGFVSFLDVTPVDAAKSLGGADLRSDEVPIRTELPESGIVSTSAECSISVTATKPVQDERGTPERGTPVDGFGGAAIPQPELESSETGTPDRGVLVVGGSSNSIGTPLTGVPESGGSSLTSGDSESPDSAIETVDDRGTPISGTPLSTVPPSSITPPLLTGVAQTIPPTGQELSAPPPGTEIVAPIMPPADALSSGDAATIAEALSVPAGTIPLIENSPIREKSSVAGLPYSGTPASTIDHHIIPDYRLYQVAQSRTQKIRRATRVQDGHSLGEQALYDALWQAGHPYSPEGRAIAIGYRHMSELARLTVNNCKANIRALIQKLAVTELSPFSHAHPTTYLVYNFTAILQRRKNAGFTHCIRSRGVVFVDPDTGTPLTVSTHSKSGTPEPTIDKTSGVPESNKKGVPPDTKSGVPPMGTLNNRNTFSQIPDPQNTSTSHFSTPDLLEGLRRLTSQVDNQAVTILWTECRARAADCTVEEILHFAQKKALLFGTGKINNPVGFLLSVVPKCFEGEAFVGFRAEMRKQQENHHKTEQDRERTRKVEEELSRRELEAYERADEKLATFSKEAYQNLYERAKKDIFQLSPSARLWTSEVLDNSIRARILRDLQRQELAQLAIS